MPLADTCGHQIRHLQIKSKHLKTPQCQQEIHWFHWIRWGIVINRWVSEPDHNWSKIFSDKPWPQIMIGYWLNPGEWASVECQSKSKHFHLGKCGACGAYRECFEKHSFQVLCYQILCCDFMYFGYQLDKIIRLHCRSYTHFMGKLVIWRYLSFSSS